MSNSRTLPNGQKERRRAPRSALRLSATLREPGRSRVGVRIIDISCNGCRVEATSGANAGSWVLLSIAGLETQYCRVVWTRNEFAGLEFATPLADQVLERLLQSQEQLSENAIRDLRDIALRTHRLASKAKDDPALAELSRKCAVDAVVEALRLGDSQQAR
jgi:hypothetical protein